MLRNNQGKAVHFLVDKFSSDYRINLAIFFLFFFKDDPHGLGSSTENFEDITEDPSQQKSRQNPLLCCCHLTTMVLTLVYLTGFLVFVILYILSSYEFSKMLNLNTKYSDSDVIKYLEGEKTYGLSLILI